MKKQIKMMAVLSAAALMTVVAPNLGNVAGSAGTVYARTTGWVQEDGEWHFYENADYYLTDSWKKYERDWYYLDSDGKVATEQMIDEYYVGKDGKRVASQWVSAPNEDEWDWDSPENFWYYYGKNGKMTVSKFLTIGGSTYYFNEEGRMQTGKITVDDSTYYMGDSTDGVMKTGWIQLESNEDHPDSETSWHYFESNGKMVENEVDKRIKGDYFTFVDGVMQTGWFKLPAADAATGSDAAPAATGIGQYRYYQEDGKRAEGWFEIEGVEGISEEGELFKFYFKNGKPYYSEQGLELFSIGSQRYVFNTRGEMQTGLQQVNTDDGSTAYYFFGEDGVMKTGRQMIYDEESGEDEVWFFTTEGAKRGQGFHGIRENILYVNGRRQAADGNLRYAPAMLDDKEYLVNVSGAVQKASSSSSSASNPELGKGFKDYKDANDQIWTVNTDGIIQK